MRSVEFTIQCLLDFYKTGNNISLSPSGKSEGFCEAERVRVRGKNLEVKYSIKTFIKSPPP